MDQQPFARAGAPGSSRTGTHASRGESGDPERSVGAIRFGQGIPQVLGSSSSRRLRDSPALAGAGMRMSVRVRAATNGSGWVYATLTARASRAVYGVLKQP
jgi:hypothetical protein